MGCPGRDVGPTAQQLGCCFGMTRQGPVGAHVQQRLPEQPWLGGEPASTLVAQQMRQLGRGERFSGGPM